MGLYTIYYILYTIYYILFTLYHILYTLYYILYTIYYILYTIYYILYTIYYTLYTILYYTCAGLREHGLGICHSESAGGGAVHSAGGEFLGGTGNTCTILPEYYIVL